MNREYQKCRSSRLGREMELLVFGHAGLPVLVFPTSGGRFYEFEDRGMIAAFAAKLDAGRVQFFCADSVNDESWYNRKAPPRQRIARHMQYEQHVLDEIVPFVRQKNPDPRLVRLGAASAAITRSTSPCATRRSSVDLCPCRAHLISPAFSTAITTTIATSICPHTICPGSTDPWFLDRFRRNKYVLATGWDDQCLGQNQELDRILNDKGIPHQIDVWDSPHSHDWPAWQRMAQQYL
jgi:esterase/lipase superfamily enzyme